MQGLRVENSDVYNSREGKIYMFNMRLAGSQPDELHIDADNDFRLVSPHGISSWKDSASGTIILSNRNIEWE